MKIACIGEAMVEVALTGPDGAARVGFAGDVLNTAIYLRRALPQEDEVAFVSMIGRDSLFLYLWHPLAFALWAACGVFGVPMLALSLATLLVARSTIAQMPRLRQILGVLPLLPGSETHGPPRVAVPEGAL